MSNWDDPNVAKDICDATSKWGFFQIVNHGVPIHVLDDVKDATPEKTLEWKDYLSLFFVSDDEIETLWPSACSRNQALEYIKSSELVFKKLLMM
ncbi:feruloyl CoA ortho-hydroxylase 1 [Tanacetum coccineum]